MTGSTDANTAKKLRAIVLAFVMVASVFTATVAFSGGAAAAPPGSINAGNTAASDFAGSGTDTAHTITADFTGAGNVGQIQLEYENGNNFEDDGGSLDNVEQEDVSVDIDGAGQSIDGIEKTDADSDGNSNVLTITLGSATSVNPTGSPDTTVTVNDVTVPDGSNNDYQLDFEIDDTLNGGGANNFNSELNQDGLAFTAFQSSASGAPQILSVLKTGSSELTITTSEGVTDGSDNPLAIGDLSYIDISGNGNSGISSVTHDAGTSTVTITTSSTLLSSDVGADEVALTSSVSDLDDNSASQNFRTIQSPLSGDSNSEISTDISGSATQNIRAGSSGQSLDLIRIKDISGGDSPLAERTILRMPNGVTINETETDLVVTTTSGNLEATGTEIVDESTLRINHSGSSDSSQSLRISGLVVDTASDVDASQGGTVNDIEVDYSIGNLDTGLLTVEKPQILTSATQSISAGASDQDTSSLNPVVIQTGTNVDGQIANQSDIIINANVSNGVTFNTDTDPTTLTASTTGNAEVDISSATLTEDALTIPVTAQFNAGDRLAIDLAAGDSIDLDATGSAEDAKLSATVVANSSTGDVTTQSSTNNPDINVQKPQIDIGNGDASDPADEAVIGASAADTNDNFVNIAGATDRIDVNFQTNNPLRSGSDIVIRTNQSDVTFATGVSTGNTVSNTNDQTFDAEITTGSPSVSNINIEENEIVVTLNNPQNIGSGDTLSLNELPVNVASSVADETRVGIVVETSPSSGTTVTTRSNITDPENDFLELEQPDVLLNNDNNATIDIDADGESEFVDPDTGASTAGDETQNALVIDAEDVNDQIGADTTVAVDLESGTGVTFDQSVTATNSGTTSLSDGDDQTTSVDAEFATVSNIQYSQGQLSFDVNSDSATGSGEITIDQLFLNLTSDASNTDLTVTTTTVSGNDVTTTAGTIVEPNTVNPSNVFADANVDEDPVGADIGPNRDGSNGGDFGGTGTGEAVDDSTTDDNPTVDETITGSVFVQDGGSDFGGASVNLELVQQPNGSEGASFNTTALTTDANGLADYEFTIGDTDGTYVVNASTDSGSTNITYEAVPGQAADVTITPIENAIAGDGTEIGQAAFFVNATDANGNAVQATPTVSLTADNIGTGEVAEFSDAAAAGSRASVDGAGETNDLSDGDAQFDIDTDGSSVVEVNTNTVQNVTITVSINENSDSGTVRFFESVGQVDLTLNESTVSTGSTVTADTTIAQSDGTTIEVPDVSVSYDDNNDGNTTFEDGADSDSATTNTNGIASVNVTAEQTGTSTIDASSNLRTDSATLTIEEQQEEPPTASITFDDQTFQNGSTSSVNVASATFNGSEDFVIVVHQASPGDNDVVDNTTEINGKIGSSDVLTNNTVSDVPVDLTKNLDENITQLTQNQTLIAMLHFANESRPGDRNFDAPITRGGSPVFDQANITITEDAQPQNPVIVGDSPATNTDDDELLEDVNGDGEADFDDAIDLAFNTEAASENVDAFDFDGDGDVDFDDAIELAFE